MTGQTTDLTAAQLADAIDALESVDWRRVPDVSAVTAGTFARTLELAREDLEGSA